MVNTGWKPEGQTVNMTGLRRWHAKDYWQILKNCKVSYIHNDDENTICYMPPNDGYLE